MAAAATKGQAQFEAVCLTGAGSLRCWDVQLTCLPARDQQNTTLICMAQDVSALRSAHLQAARQNQLLNTALSSGELGHWAHNLDSGDFKCSPCFRQQFGLPEAGPVSAKDVFTRIDAGTLPAFNAARETAIKSGGSHALEVHTTDRDGQRRILMTHFHIEESMSGQRHVSGVSRI